MIAGPSGCGKSTLAGAINGLNPFSNPGECSGELIVDGVDAPKSSIFQLSAHVGTVLQDPDGQFIGLTVGEILPLHWRTAACRRMKCMRSPVTRQSWLEFRIIWITRPTSFPRAEAARQPGGGNGGSGENFVVR